MTFGPIGRHPHGTTLLWSVDAKAGRALMYHDYGYGGGNHWGLWILMIVVMLAFWGALAWIIVTLVRHRGTPHTSIPPAPVPGSPPPGPDARRILDERLARGDIDEDEYTRRRSLIEGTG